jgi:hypothetical protein
MALYPETTTFYRAVVVAGPKDPPPPGFRVSFLLNNLKTTQIEWITLYRLCRVDEVKRRIT